MIRPCRSQNDFAFEIWFEIENKNNVGIARIQMKSTRNLDIVIFLWVCKTT